MSVNQQFVLRHEPTITDHHENNEAASLTVINMLSFIDLLPGHQLLLLELLLWNLQNKPQLVTSSTGDTAARQQVSCSEFTVCFHGSSKGVLSGHQCSITTWRGGWGCGWIWCTASLHLLLHLLHLLLLLYLLTFFFWATSSSGLGTICSFSVRIISMWQGELM